ncbi:hypothetical protein E4631_03795 [Hymenobacter sp. UV11]|uniref:Arm DNA-binding domain-containing protein n=1 Tax=Hymenobacter sp. UV11 TaxID=1849735 RepID=UPI001060CABF|nr:Arm DNA-binding domain-containing protein [Hymenobacter sp. UV11]TDN36052.1 hypothetical protein A8B98_11690 [Hymenobacter sp. UV11]TFZ68122.1 hypothetical protein E4631_03795 [Hymenobacter sp. UV11]
MTIKFERRPDQADAAGRCLVHLRAYFDGPRLRISTRERCTAAEWQEEKGKFRKSFTGCQDANDTLHALAERVTKRPIFGQTYCLTCMDPIATRRLEILASNILFFGLAVALVDSAWTMRGALHKPSTLGLLLVSYVVFGGFYYAIRRGVTLVKWLFVLGQIAMLLYTLVQYRTTLLPLLHTQLWTALAYVAFFGSRVVAMFVLLPTLRTRRLALIH